MVCWGGLFVLRWVRRGVGRVEKMGVVRWERKRAVVFVGVPSVRTASPLHSSQKTGRNPSPLSPSTLNQTISQWVLSWVHQAAATARRC